MSKWKRSDFYLLCKKSTRKVASPKFWGVPQRRKRIALVADFGGLSAPEILFERAGLRGDFEAGSAARKELAGGTAPGVGGAGTVRMRAGCEGGVKAL